VGTDISQGNQFYGFLGNNGSYTEFEIGETTNANAINDAGQIVGFYEGADSLEHGFITSAAPEASTLAPAVLGILMALGGYGWHCRKLNAATR
jgi:probable HAF family extracellular repeat protein